MVSLENSNCPVLGLNSKSLRQELQRTNIEIESRTYRILFIDTFKKQVNNSKNGLKPKNITFEIMK